MVVEIGPETEIVGAVGSTSSSARFRADQDPDCP